MIEWIRRRITDGKNGYGYLGLLVGFVSLLLLIRINFPAALYPFTPLVGFGLVAIAVFFGYLHRISKQWRTDNNYAFLNSPLSAKMTRIILRNINGTATKEETDWALTLLQSIENGEKHDS